MNMRTKKCTLNICIALMIFSFFLSGCKKSEQTAPQVGGRTFIITPPAGSSKSSLPMNTKPDFSILSDEDSQLQQAPAARVPLDSDSILLSIINENLDIDQTDEQIIVVKGRNAELDKIKVLVVDFDTVRNGYFITWQGTTNATDSRNFSLYTADITGDHNFEIVCAGIDAAGLQTLNIFRKTTSPTGYGLYYISIGNFVVDGTAEVIDVERSQAYELEQKAGQSFPIVTYTRDTASENGADLLKSTYYWKYQDNAYVLGSTEKIPMKNVQEKQLQNLFNDDKVESFERYLSGPWLLSSTDKRDPLSPGDIILFEVDARKITFYSRDIQEIYTWNASRKNIFRGLSIQSENESINSIQRQISVSVQALDTIIIDVGGNEQWSGVYKKLSPEVQNSLLKRSPSHAQISSLSLSGMYRNDKNLEIHFLYPTIRIVENGVSLTGGYMMYTAGKEILEIRILKENGLVAESRTYIVEFNEDKDETKITRVIRLTPATVGIRGVEPLGKGTIRLEQIEIVEKEPAGKKP